jgi:3-hydroxyacyl-CoA dehydrogenase
MMARGWRGKSTGWGFYKWVKEHEGDTSDLVIDLDSMRYLPRRQAPMPELVDVSSFSNAGERIARLMQADHKAGRFAWRILSQVMAYAAWMVDRGAGDVADIDRAMHYVFGWSLGPFEIWSALGVAGTARRMQGKGIKLPQWVTELVERDGAFYESVKEATV